MKRIILATAAAVAAVSMTGCGIVSDQYDRHRLEQAWDDASTDEQTAICTG